MCLPDVLMSRRNRLLLSAGYGSDVERGSNKRSAQKLGEEGLDVKKVNSVEKVIKKGAS